MGLVIVLLIISLLFLGTASFLLLDCDEVQGEMIIKIDHCLTINFHNGTNITECEN